MSTMDTKRKIHKDTRRLSMYKNRTEHTSGETNHSRAKIETGCSFMYWYTCVINGINLYTKPLYKYVCLRVYRISWPNVFVPFQAYKHLADDIAGCFLLTSVVRRHHSVHFFKEVSQIGSFGQL